MAQASALDGRSTPLTRNERSLRKWPRLFHLNMDKGWLLAVQQRIAPLWVLAALFVCSAEAAGPFLLHPLCPLRPVEKQ